MRYFPRATEGGHLSKIACQACQVWAWCPAWECVGPNVFAGWQLNLLSCMATMATMATEVLRPRMGMPGMGMPMIPGMALPQSKPAETTPKAAAT